jgi:hypothetical protein
VTSEDDRDPRRATISPRSAGSARGVYLAIDCANRISIFCSTQLRQSAAPRPERFDDT